MKSTTIPVEGDRDFVDAFGTFAKKKKTTMAALTRHAINLAYGNELEPYLTFFVAPNGASLHQSEEQRTIEESANAER